MCVCMQVLGIHSFLIVIILKCSDLSFFSLQNLKGATSMKMQILCFDSIMMHCIILRRRKKT